MKSIVGLAFILALAFIVNVEARDPLAVTLARLKRASAAFAASQPALVTEDARIEEMDDGTEGN